MHKLYCRNSTIGTYNYKKNNKQKAN